MVRKYVCILSSFIRLIVINAKHVIRKAEFTARGFYVMHLDTKDDGYNWKVNTLLISIIVQTIIVLGLVK